MHITSQAPASISTSCSPICYIRITTSLHNEHTIIICNYIIIVILFYLLARTFRDCNVNDAHIAAKASAKTCMLATIWRFLGSTSSYLIHTDTECHVSLLAIVSFLPFSVSWCRHDLEEGMESATTTAKCSARSSWSPLRINARATSSLPTCKYYT